MGDLFYIVAMVVFAWMTFAIVRGNFQRKFNDEGERIDLVEKEKTNPTKPERET
jgi:ribose 5-phosphate isomerase RpiB